LVFLVLVPIAIYAFVAIGDRWLQARSLTREAELLRDEIIEARGENQRLQTRIALARTDQAIEAIAREELNLVRPGDTPVVLLVATPTPGPPGTPRASTPTPTR
jgi:cell division protein FtsB